MRALARLVCFVLFIAVIGCDPKRRDAAQPGSGPATGPAAAQPVAGPTVNAEADKWFDASNAMWLKAGQFAVQVASADVRFVDVKSFGDGSTSKEKLMVVRLSICNRHPNKKANYSGWAGSHFSLGEGVAKLTDEFDNKYKRITFGFATHVVGQVEGSESIFPGKIITDVLVFEQPVASARTLFLELPGENLGEKDVSFYFRIPLDRPVQTAKLPAKQPIDKKEPAVEPAGPLVGYGPFHAALDAFGRSYLELEKARNARDKAEADRLEAIRLAKEKAEKDAADAIAKKLNDEVEAQKLYEKVTARIHLLELIEKYPNTRAAALAAERLKKLDKK